MIIDRASAETYAGWFRCLGDGTRIQILNLLASEGERMSIREIVDVLDVGQPTVSHHVKQLEQARFVSCERVGASTLVRLNRRCLQRFPSAAKLVMGVVPATEAPWSREAAA
jgi:ArsR family transcriptional regulator, arsenate/arsenite/antimonite-responsive transcriptional repressor